MLWINLKARRHSASPYHRRCSQQLDAYLAIREAVGFTNKSQYRLLRDFVAYVQNAGSRLSDPCGNCRYRGLGRRADNLLRQRASRPLMGWSAAFLLSWPASYREPRCRAFRIVAGATRRRPCIFLDEEVEALISDAACPNPRHPFRPIVLSTLFGHRLARRRGDPPEHERRTARC
jgi:integrase/recombinase XerD